MSKPVSFSLLLVWLQHIGYAIAIAGIDLLIVMQPGWSQIVISPPTLPDDDLKYQQKIDEIRLSEGKWQIKQSFRAAYISWDLIETFSEQIPPKSQTSTRSFDDDYSLDLFYGLETEFATNFTTGSLEHETSLSVEINKNLFSLPRQDPVDRFKLNQLPSPFSTSDLIRQQNTVDISLEHGITLGNNFSLYIDGEMALEIPEATATPELPTLAWVEGEPFAPEISIYYEPNQSLSLYASYSSSAQRIFGQNFEGKPFKPEITREFELGIETKLLEGKMLASLSWNHSIQKYVTTADPDRSDFQIQVDQQQTRAIEFSLEGEIAPRWNLNAYYTYTDARIAEDERLPIGNPINDVARHTGGIWSTYETQGGFGLGGGLTFVGDRPANLQNIGKLPSYLQTDLVFFYHRPNYQAALNLQNLFHADNGESQPFRILGTIQIKF
jgi:iron complex outermembrane receptor protein